MKIVTIVGARPQFIKAAAVSRILRQKHKEILIHTGQHYDNNMSEVFFEELNISKPDYNLGVGSASHAQQTAEMMVKIEKILIKEKPDMVLVYGDTNSTLATAIATAKLLIPLAHVEAGPRTRDFNQPEEQNRIVTDHLSQLLFAATNSNVENLNNEGLFKGVYNVGDVMFDALLYYGKVATENGLSYFYNRLNFLDKKISEDTLSKGWYFTTIHRPQNTDTRDNLLMILNALNRLKYPVIFSVHPRTKKVISDIYSNYKNIYFVEPLSYIDTIYFTKNAIKVITDSGGLHKEAYLQSVQCVTVLQSGWVETCHDGWNTFVKPNEKEILDAIELVKLTGNGISNEFGDGHAAEKIVANMENYLRRK